MQQGRQWIKDSSDSASLLDTFILVLCKIFIADVFNTNLLKISLLNSYGSIIYTSWMKILLMRDKSFYLSSFHLLSCHLDYAQPPYHCKWLLIARRLLKPALEGCLESNLSRQLSTRASAPLSTKPRYLAKGECEQFYMKQKWLHEKQYIIFSNNIKNSRMSA